MYLLSLALFIVIALTIWFVFVSDASTMAKVLIAALFISSIFLHPVSFPMAGLILQIGISIFILLYQMVQTAKSQ